jgi:hypothetical protein
MMAGLVRIRPMSRFCGRPGGVPLSLRLRVLRALKSGSNVGLQESSESGVAPRRLRRFGSAICSPDFRLTLGRPGSYTAKCRSSSLGATASGCEDAADNQAKRPVFLPGGCKVRATMLAILAITPPPSAAARELVNGRSGGGDSGLRLGRRRPTGRGGRSPFRRGRLRYCGDATRTRASAACCSAPTGTRRISSWSGVTGVRFTPRCCPGGSTDSPSRSGSPGCGCTISGTGSQRSA